MSKQMTEKKVEHFFFFRRQNYIVNALCAAHVVNIFLRPCANWKRARKSLIKFQKLKRFFNIVVEAPTLNHFTMKIPWCISIHD